MTPLYDWQGGSLGPAKVIDLDTGDEIQNVLWCDTESGIFCKTKLNNGHPYVTETGDFDDRGRPVLALAQEVGRTRLRVEFKGKAEVGREDDR